MCKYEVSDIVKRFDNMGNKERVTTKEVLRV